MTPNEAARHGLDINKDGRRRTAFELLAYPGIELARLAAIWPGSARSTRRLPPSSRSMPATPPMSTGRRPICGFPKEESVRIPAGFDYAGLPGLSAEVRQKLDALRPTTLAQATRMEGMTPAALMLLLAHLRKGPARKTA